MTQLTYSQAAVIYQFIVQGVCKRFPDHWSNQAQVEFKNYNQEHYKQLIWHFQLTPGNLKNDVHVKDDKTKID